MATTIFNYAVFELERWRWHLVGRYPSPQAAAADRDRGVVLDVVSDRVIWRNGAWCSRQKPATIPTLAIEKYTD